MTKGRNDYYKHGDQNAICDECGFKFKLSELRARWDGAQVCSLDWEPRHPRDLLPPTTPEAPPKAGAPESEPEYTSLTYITYPTADIPTGTFGAPTVASGIPQMRVEILYTQPNPVSVSGTEQRALVRAINLNTGDYVPGSEGIMLQLASMTTLFSGVSSSTLSDGKPLWLDFQVSDPDDIGTHDIYCIAYNWAGLYTAEHTNSTLTSLLGAAAGSPCSRMPLSVVFVA